MDDRPCLPTGFGAVARARWALECVGPWPSRVARASAAARRRRSAVLGTSCQEGRRRSRAFREGRLPHEAGSSRRRPPPADGVHAPRLVVLGCDGSRAAPLPRPRARRCSLVPNDHHRLRGRALGRPRSQLSAAARSIASCRMGSTSAASRRLARPEGETILWVGRLAPPKRPDLAIDALRILKRTRPGARLDLVGDGPLLGHAQSAARRCGRRGRCAVARSLATMCPSCCRGLHASCSSATTRDARCRCSRQWPQACRWWRRRWAASPSSSSTVRRASSSSRIGPKRSPRPSTSCSLIPYERKLSVSPDGKRANEHFSRESMIAATVACYEEIVAEARLAGVTSVG